MAPDRWTFPSNSTNSENLGSGGRVNPGAVELLSMSLMDLTHNSKSNWTGQPDWRRKSREAGGIGVRRLLVNLSPLSTPPQKLGADNQAAWESWHLAMTLAADFVDQLNG